MKKSLKFSKKTKKTKKNFRRKTKKSIHKKYKKTYKKYFGGVGDVEDVEDVSVKKRGAIGDDVLDESQIQRRKIEVLPFYKQRLEGLENPEAVLDRLFNNVVKNTSEENISRAYQQMPADHIYSGKTLADLRGMRPDTEEPHKNGQTLLTFFTKWRSKPEDLARLIRSGADVNAPNINGDTPLIIAAQGGWPANMNVLLENGADPNQKDSNGKQHSCI